MEAKQAAVAAVTDLDEDFYGDESYSADEFDSEGFDEMTFDNCGPAHMSYENPRRLCLGVRGILILNTLLKCSIP